MPTTGGPERQSITSKFKCGTAADVRHYLSLSRETGQLRQP